MRSVAQDAGVSSAVVSYVLSGRDVEMRIPEKTRERVLEACRRLNYRTNHVARAMRTSKTMTFGLMFTNSRGYFMTDLLEGAQSVLRENGYHPIICTCGDDPKVEVEELLTMMSRGVDGIIAFPAYSEHPHKVWNEVKARGVPLVFVDMLPEGVLSDCVRIDDSKVGGEAAMLMADDGIESTFIVSAGLTAPTVAERESGFREMAARKGIEILDTVGVEDMDAFVGGLPSGRPVGAFAAVGRWFMTGLMSMHRRGVLAQYAHCSLYSIGDVEGYAAAFVPMRWMTAEQPARKMGKFAAARLLQLMDDATASDPAVTVVPCEWQMSSAKVSKCVL